MDHGYNEEPTTQEYIERNDWMQRRDFFKVGISIAGAVMPPPPPKTKAHA